MEQKTPDISLFLETSELTESAIRGHETAFRRLIRENVDGAEIIAAASPPKDGAKGDPITIGLIAITLIKSGAAVSLINCIKSIVTRERKLKIKIKNKNGRTIEVDATNVDSKALKEQLEELVKA